LNGKVLITGGAGFIGSHLAALHVSCGDRVTLADLRPASGIIQTDLTALDGWSALGGGYDFVYHLAAVNGTELFYSIPHEVLRTNILTTIYALDWFRTNCPDGKILFTSSNEAYAGALEAFGVLPLPTPEDVPLVVADVANPRWSYGGSKLVGEQLFTHYASAYGLRTVIVRPHNFYGPRAGTRHVIPQLIDRIVRRVDPFPLYGPDETRSFCYIDDAVEALRSVMLSDRTDGGTFHIGSPVETRIADLADTMFEVAGWRPDRVVAAPSPAGSVRRRVPDVSRVREAVGWEATTPLEAGLRMTYKWWTA
jgi:nucleoside-diphosphate-sugar epimerase